MLDFGLTEGLSIHIVKMNSLENHLRTILSKLVMPKLLARMCTLYGKK